MNQSSNQPPKFVNILMVEDDPGDALLTRKALSNGKVYNSLSVVGDGEEAFEFLHKKGKYADAVRPDLILLDLNMPRMDGREFLEKVKLDENLRQIPVVVLTTSDADKDIVKTYDLQASCYITKPVDLMKFTEVVKSLKNFWLSVVRFPEV